MSFVRNSMTLFSVVTLVIFLFYVQLFKSLNSSEKISPKIQNKNNEYEKISRQKTQKWIVVTSINEPTKQIDTLSKQDDFLLLVVGDLKTNQRWHYPKVTFLNVQTQNNLKFKSLSTTLFNSYTRKNIGYLYAIKQGAGFIYDTDDDNEPITNLNKYFDFGLYKTELELDSDSPLIINPYAHFGQPTIWPRGYPLNEINKRFYNSYVCSKKPTSIIQQSVVNGDPDVDAIFRLSKSLDQQKFDIYFDETAPSFRIPKYKLTPFNSQNTLYHYKAFWALYLPHSVSFRLTDIWRSYWSQRLLWLLDSTVSFLGPNAYQLRNSHSYLADYKQEKDMFLKTKDLIHFLYKWKCKSKIFFECVIDLTTQMAQNSFWNTSEIDGVKNWLDDLKSFNYIEPTITNFAYELSNKDIKEFVKHENGKFDKDSFRVRFTPNFKASADLEIFFGKNNYLIETDSKLKTIKYFVDYCGSNYKLDFDYKKIYNGTTNTRNSILLITFNHEVVAENVVFLKFFHQSYFKNIVFCGKQIMNVLKFEKIYKKFDSYTFIEYDTSQGYFHYVCMSKLIDLNYRTDGILLMSDDIILKHWNLDNFSSRKIWYHSTRGCNITYEDRSKWVYDAKYWLGTEFGAPALKNAFEHLESQLNNLNKTEETDLIILKRFFQIYNSNLNLDKNQKKISTICKDTSDLYYLPNDFFSTFNFMSKIFRSHNLFLEFAIPIILRGLDEISSTQILDGLFFWPQQFILNEWYSKVKHFGHPVKVMKYNEPEERRKICQTYIQDKFNNF